MDEITRQTYLKLTLLGERAYTELSDEAMCYSFDCHTTDRELDFKYIQVIIQLIEPTPCLLDVSVDLVFGTLQIIEHANMMRATTTLLFQRTVICLDIPELEPEFLERALQVPDALLQFLDHFLVGRKNLVTVLSPSDGFMQTGQWVPVLILSRGNVVAAIALEHFPGRVVSVIGNRIVALEDGVGCFGTLHDARQKVAAAVAELASKPWPDELVLLAAGLGPGIGIHDGVVSCRALVGDERSNIVEQQMRVDTETHGVGLLLLSSSW